MAALKGLPDMVNSDESSEEGIDNLGLQYKSLSLKQPPTMHNPSVPDIVDHQTHKRQRVDQRKRIRNKSMLKKPAAASAASAASDASALEAGLSAGQRRPLYAAEVAELEAAAAGDHAKPKRGRNKLSNVTPRVANKCTDPNII